MSKATRDWCDILLQVFRITRPTKSNDRANREGQLYKGGPDKVYRLSMIPVEATRYPLVRVEMGKAVANQRNHWYNLARSVLVQELV